MMNLRSERDGDRELPAEYLMERMRIFRNRLLADTDWTQTADNPTGNGEAWATYRQQLRDFPATWTPSDTADFPEPPA
jgi:hypothetical protein